MKRIAAILLAGAAFVLPGCNHAPMHALKRDCGPGGGSRIASIMDWQCTDGDGEERLRPRPLTRIVGGKD